MSSDFRTKNMTVLVDVEATPGVEVVPTVALNAVLMEQPTAARKLETIDSNEVTGSLSARGASTGGGTQNLSGVAYLKGSDVVGSPPQYRKLLRGCAMHETILAADEACVLTAGGAATSTLSAAPAVAPLPGQVVTVTAGTGIGQTRVITGWNGGTRVLSTYPDFTVPLDATSTLAIKAGALYVPASTALETVTAYRYRNSAVAGELSKLDKILGTAGTFKIDIAARQPGKITFTLTGVMQPPVDVAFPGAATYDACKAPPFLNAQAYFNNTKIQLNAFSLDLGATIGQADDPAALFGYDVANVAARKVVGSFDAPIVLKTVRDAFADWAAGNAHPLWLCWGNTPGNRVSLYLPAVAPKSDDEKDDSGNAYESIQFSAQGIDSEFMLATF